MRFTETVRRYFERKGYALMPRKQFEGIAEERHRLVDELAKARRLGIDLSERITALEHRNQLVTEELNALGVVSGLREALVPGTAGVQESANLDERGLRSRFIERLQAWGMPLEVDEPVFLHVGFGHSGTTSLQSNFFARRPDLFYLGTPYAEAGGLFSNLKYVDDRRLNEQQMLQWCRDVVYRNPRRAGRPIVISDETFCDTSEVFYCPRHVPGDLLARRLKRYFPTAKIVFTIRNQLDYVSSMYFNLRRNYAFLAGVTLPEFDEWWAGIHSQLQGLYLQNLNYVEMIDDYGRLFGRENLIVLPLEELKTHGVRQYLEKLYRFMGLEPREADVTDFSIPRNERMTVVESRLARLVSAGSSEWTDLVRSLLDKESMAELIAGAPRLSVKFNDEQLREIKRVVVPGNRRLTAEFGIPLGELGYFV